MIDRREFMGSLVAVEHDEPKDPIGTARVSDESLRRLDY